ncbi:MAG: ammonia channel protein, partial [Rugosibacter sp.]|nr:ammonia channel protein [Rugosibacter sp.]
MKKLLAVLLAACAINAGSLAWAEDAPAPATVTTTAPVVDAATADPAVAAIAAPVAAEAAPVAAAPSPVPNKGDTAWMLMSTALVLLMSIPALALFYGGLVRTKNMLSVLM